MHLIPLFALCLLAVLLGGCQTRPLPEGTGSALGQRGAFQTFTAADNGKTVSLRVGESLTVSLQGNASTGYSWSISENGAPVLVQSGSPVSLSEASGTGLVGAPETTTWTFTAQQEGEAALKLEYRRPWEKAAAPVQTFELKVTTLE